MPQKLPPAPSAAIIQEFLANIRRIQFDPKQPQYPRWIVDTPETREADETYDYCLASSLKESQRFIEEFAQGGPLVVHGPQYRPPEPAPLRVESESDRVWLDMTPELYRVLILLLTYTFGKSTRSGIFPLAYAFLHELKRVSPEKLP